MEMQIIWDLEDDPTGNVQHLLEHDATMEEFEEVVLNPKNPVRQSKNRAHKVTFGETSTGRYLAAVWEPVLDDPMTIKPVTAYDVPPPRSGRHEC
jgi:hypothetical protein